MGRRAAAAGRLRKINKSYCRGPARAYLVHTIPELCTILWKSRPGRWAQQGRSLARQSRETHAAKPDWGDQDETIADSRDPHPRAGRRASRRVRGAGVRDATCETRVNATCIRQADSRCRAHADAGRCRVARMWRVPHAVVECVGPARPCSDQWSCPHRPRCWSQLPLHADDQWGGLEHQMAADLQRRCRQADRRRGTGSRPRAPGPC